MGRLCLGCPLASMLYSLKGSEHRFLALVALNGLCTGAFRAAKILSLPGMSQNLAAAASTMYPGAWKWLEGGPKRGERLLFTSFSMVFPCLPCFSYKFPRSLGRPAARRVHGAPGGGADLQLLGAPGAERAGRRHAAGGPGLGAGGRGGRLGPQPAAPAAGGGADAGGVPRGGHTQGVPAEPHDAAHGQQPGGLP